MHQKLPFLGDGGASGFNPMPGNTNAGGNGFNPELDSTDRAAASMKGG